MTIGGLVVARQRPGTAKGIVFLLLEDEFGTINLIVPPDVYERHRLTVRTEPLILAGGRLEQLADGRRGDQRLRQRLEPLVTPGEDVAGVVELAERRAAAAAAEAPADRAAARGRPERDPGGLPRRRPGRAELRVGAAAMSAVLSRAARTSNLPRRMTTLDLRPRLGGPRARPAARRPQRRPGGALQRLQSQSRGEPQAAIVLFALALLVLGIGVPARGDRSRRGARRHPGGQREQPHGGREARPRAVRRSAARTATRSRPPTRSRRSARTSTTLRPPKALVLDAIKNGRAHGNGQMAAGLYAGPGRRGRRRLRGQGRRADRARASSSAPPPAVLCRKHRKVPLSRRFLQVLRCRFASAEYALKHCRREPVS